MGLHSQRRPHNRKRPSRLYGGAERCRARLHGLSAKSRTHKGHERGRDLVITNLPVIYKCLPMAEGAGFEPAIRFPVYTLSRRAPSTTRPPLLRSRVRSAKGRAYHCDAARRKSDVPTQRTWTERGLLG